MNRENALRFWDLVYVAGLGWACYALYTHRQLGIGASWGKLVIGLACILGLFLNQWAPKYLKRSRQAAARQIFELHKALYAGPHEYRTVEPEEFPELDIDFYERSLAWFKANGFRSLGDREDLTVTRTLPQNRTFIRSTVSADGTVLAAAYHLRIRTPGFSSDSRTIEFSTEFSDGTYLTTSNALTTARTRPIPGIRTSRYPAASPADELLRIHLGGLAERIQSQTALRATPVHTLDEFIEVLHRMESLQAAYKRETGFVSAADMREARGRELNAHELAIVEEIEKLKAQV
jgi:hypothetical protein